jgi:chitin disaccharide deacetylase
MLIINADDYGRSPEATDNILRCLRAGAVTSASAMVFMTDSRRAAGLARASGLDTGLHLNLDLPFDAQDTPPELRRRQLRIAGYFRLGRWAQVVDNPFLRRDLTFVVRTQREEYGRLYGADPARVDGHHHLHLSANMLRGRLLPAGAVVRRSFTFGPGEKSFFNRAYRRRIDRRLARRHICADAFFSIEPLDDMPRLGRIIELARTHDVELMVHPGRPREVEFLLSPRILALLGDCPRGTYRQLAQGKRERGTPP